MSDFPFEFPDDALFNESQTGDAISADSAPDSSSLATPASLEVPQMIDSRFCVGPGPLDMDMGQHVSDMDLRPFGFDLDLSTSLPSKPKEDVARSYSVAEPQQVWARRPFNALDAHPPHNGFDETSPSFYRQELSSPPYLSKATEAEPHSQTHGRTTIAAMSGDPGTLGDSKPLPITQHKQGQTREGINSASTLAGPAAMPAIVAPDQSSTSGAAVEIRSASGNGSSNGTGMTVVLENVDPTRMAELLSMIYASGGHWRLKLNSENG